MRSCIHRQLRQLAKIIKPVAHPALRDRRNADPRFSPFKRHTDRAGSHHIQIPVAPFFIAVVVARENLLYAILVQQFQIPLPGLARNVEILIRFTRIFQEKKK